MINGGMKFFGNNYALLKNGGIASASSNDSAASAITDISKYTQWQSSGSNDTTTEIITIDLSTNYEINRVFLLDTNFKNFNIKYYDGEAYVDFTNVVGVNGAESVSILETDYSEDTAYYEFDNVTTNSILVEVLSSQVVDAEKFLTQVIIAKEIGTLKGFPRIVPQAERNETKSKTLSGKYIVQKSYETNQIKTTFKSHPYQEDLDIIEELFLREEPFLVYPCGGRKGENYFKFDMINWRLKDIYNMQIVGKLKNEFEKGVYLLGFNKTITFEEHI